ncbi:hypothetical protein J2S61_000052 [Microbacterium barkeri]|nr:hypothetical protein [Microbacterium barkeri]
MKWTRQRCQAAPCNTVAAAFFSPAWASEITSFIPESPRVFNERRNCFQNCSVSLSPTSKPSTTLRPSAATPIATTTAWETTRWSMRTLQ